MLPFRHLLIYAICSMTVFSFSPPSHLIDVSLPAGPILPKDGWESLYNGKDLSGWDTYLGPALDDSGKIIGNEPIGLNKDPGHVFTIVKADGENLIRISGEKWGAISTQKEYADYHLQLLFQWGTLTWGQKKNKKRDSGLLYHSVGRFGAEYGAWMRSQEFQIEEGNTGDFWGVGGGTQDIPVTKTADGEWIYDPAGQLSTFNATSPIGRHCTKRGDAEKPWGGWNQLDLYCHGDTSVHVVNGQVMMVLYHSRQPDNGAFLPLVKGKLQIQSEGAEVFYKAIRIQPLEAIPGNLFR